MGSRSACLAPAIFRSGRVTERRQLDERLASLDEIREIMSSLKTLAFLETRKLARYTENQRQSLACIDAASADFAAHFPVESWQPLCTLHAYVVLGSERGFCGKYNELLAAAVQEAISASPGLHAVIAVGQKFIDRWGPTPDLIGIEGASIAEDVQAVLLRLADAVATLQRDHGNVALSVIYQDPASQQVVTRTLFPVIPSSARRATGSPPQLNVESQAMFSALLEEYLYAALLAASYDALSAENHRRVEHLEGAVEHLDRQCSAIRLKRNYLRQEEITEEIEAILLSAEATARS